MIVYGTLPSPTWDLTLCHPWASKNIGIMILHLSVHCPLSTGVLCIQADWLVEGSVYGRLLLQGGDQLQERPRLLEHLQGNTVYQQEKKWAAVNTCFNEIVFKKLLNVKDILFHLKNIFSTPPGNFFLPPLNLSKWIPILILQLRLFSILCVCIEVMYYWGCLHRFCECRWFQVVFKCKFCALPLIKLQKNAKY